MTEGAQKVAHSCLNSAKRHQDYVVQRLLQLDDLARVSEFIDQDEIEDLMRLGMVLSSQIDRMHHDYQNAIQKAQDDKLGEAV